MRYNIHISVHQGQVLDALIAAKTVVIGLNIESLLVETNEGFQLLVKKDSNTSDLLEIYKLTKENIKLKSDKNNGDVRRI